MDETFFFGTEISCPQLGQITVPIRTPLCRKCSMRRV
nr:MAG TPA: hypothetical protein [Bacteriophage sp.]